MSANRLQNTIARVQVGWEGGRWEDGRWEGGGRGSVTASAYFKFATPFNTRASVSIL